MNIQRINIYSDPRFSQTVLNQHGCFLAEEEPYEVEILSEKEAVIRGRDVALYPQIIEEFRFYSPHITTFYAENGSIVCRFPPVQLLSIPLADIQPSQFYVDEEKIAAVSSFLTCGEDIVIPLLKQGDRYISLDGHTRLYYAVKMGWSTIRAVEDVSDDFIYSFVEEARKRNIISPYDLRVLSHQEYEQKWNKFCDDFFAQSNAK